MREDLKREILQARMWFYMRHPGSPEAMRYVDLAETPEGRLLAGLCLLDGHLDAMERDYKRFRIRPEAVSALPVEMQKYAELGGIYRYEQQYGDWGWLMEEERPDGEPAGIGVKASGVFMEAYCDMVD